MILGPVLDFRGALGRVEEEWAKIPYLTGQSACPGAWSAAKVSPAITPFVAEPKHFAGHGC